jgi:hypothetical protein
VRHVILVVTSLDRVDEPERVMRSVRRKAAELAPGMPVLPGPGRTPDPERLGAVREAIEAVDAAAVTADRRRRVAARLAEEARVLTALAEAARARQEAADAEADAAVDQEAVWRGLRTALARRQRHLLDRLHGEIDDGRDAVAERLGRELAEVPDPAAWWNDELPELVRRELIDTRRRLEATIAAGSADGEKWLELELRTQLGVRDLGAGRDHEPLDAVPVTAAPEVRKARESLLGSMARALASVAGPMVRQARSSRGNDIAAALIPTAAEALDHLLRQRAGEQQRAELIGQLPRYVRRNLDALKDAVTTEVAAHERAELDRLDQRWSDWRAVRLKAGDEATADVAGLVSRALTLSRQADLLETTTRGMHS